MGTFLNWFNQERSLLTKCTKIQVQFCLQIHFSYNWFLLFKSHCVYLLLCSSKVTSTAQIYIFHHWVPFPLLNKSVKPDCYCSRLNSLSIPESIAMTRKTEGAYAWAECTCHTSPSVLRIIKGLASQVKTQDGSPEGAGWKLSSKNSRYLSQGDRTSPQKQMCYRSWKKDKELER